MPEVNSDQMEGTLLQNESSCCFAFFHVWGMHPASCSVLWDGLGKGAEV